jgi:hypothetical protein
MRSGVLTKDEALPRLDSVQNYAKSGTVLFEIVTSRAEHFYAPA